MCVPYRGRGACGLSAPFTVFLRCDAICPLKHLREIRRVVKAYAFRHSINRRQGFAKRVRRLNQPAFVDVIEQVLALLRLKQP